MHKLQRAKHIAHNKQRFGVHVHYLCLHQDVQRDGGHSGQKERNKHRNHYVAELCIAAGCTGAAAHTRIISFVRIVVISVRSSTVCLSLSL